MSCSTSCHLIPLPSFLYPFLFSLLQVFSHLTLTSLLPLILYHFLIARYFCFFAFIYHFLLDCLTSLSPNLLPIFLSSTFLLPFIFYYFLSSHTTTGILISLTSSHPIPCPLFYRAYCPCPTTCHPILLPNSSYPTSSHPIPFPEEAYFYSRHT